MSDGLSVIAALLREGSRNGYRRLRVEYFREAELPAWNLLVDHYRRHGELPSEEVFRRAGINLVDINDNFGYYLNEVQRRAIFDAALGHWDTMSQAVQARDIDALVEVSRQMSIDIGSLRAEQNIQTMVTTIPEVIEDYDIAHSAHTLRGVTLGWQPLDDLTAGAQPGDLGVLLARPNIGKTYTLLHMCLSAWTEGYSVLFVSMEMTALQVARRVIGLYLGLNPDLLRRGQLSTHIRPRLNNVTQVFGDVGRAPFYILPGDFNKTTGDVDALVQEFGPDIVYIDASYLLKPSTKSNYRAKWETQAQIHEELKGTALARALPIMASVQVNRAGGKSKKPEIGSAAGSDVIEQIASLLLMVRKGAGIQMATRRRFDLIKNRDGPTGSFTTHWKFDPPNFAVDHEPLTDTDGDGEDSDENNRRRAASRRQMASRQIS